MTGKAAELAAILTRLPLDVDYFQYLEPDLVQQGVLSPDTLNWVYEVLRQLPLAITQDELRERLHQNRSWYIRQLSDHQKLRTVVATQKADSTFESLLAGWRDPVMRRAVSATHNRRTLWSAAACHRRLPVRGSCQELLPDRTPRRMDTVDHPLSVG